MKRFWNRITVLCFAILLVSAIAQSCKQGNKPSDQNSVASKQATEPQSAEPKVTQIVFVGKENACACTRTRIDESWGALQQALGTRKDISVDRIHIDTEEMKVAPYQKMRTIMVIPAIYFLDASGALVDMLQGEVTAEQILGVLQRESK